MFPFRHLHLTILISGVLSGVTNGFVTRIDFSQKQQYRNEVQERKFNPTGTLLFSTKPKNQLTRPERKALERKNKAMKNNNNKKKNQNNGQKQTNTLNTSTRLHSNNISELTPKSTADDVIKAIKRAQNRHDEHDLRIIGKFLIQDVGFDFGYGFRGSLLARLAVAALHMANNDITNEAIQLRRTEYRSSMLPMESAAIVRGLLRNHNVTEALNVLHDELHLPLEGTPLDSPENKDLLKYRARAIASIASRHFFENEPVMAIKSCKLLSELGPMVRRAGLTAEDLAMPWARIILGAAQCESGRRDGSVVISDKSIELPVNLVYSVLNAMTTFPSDNDDKTYENLSNALVRRTCFITGATNMSRCPEADRGEVIFIGRSNVGKSSLVNMVTNRKSLAFTSKRPGKTQQFNYFAINDKPGKEKEVRYGDVVVGDKDPDSFYILDVPGFGYAKVPEKQRQDWSNFLAEYVTSRKTLRVIFHLIDGRHGAIDEDIKIMTQMGEIKPHKVQYVVVLTKADKNVKSASTKNAGKVSKGVLENVRSALQSANLGDTPVLLTSSETKLGRDDIWRYMSLAASLDSKKA
jgi:ribosome biogenesis GTP-binding protein YsxC/EngB